MSSGRGLPAHRTSKKLMLRVRPGVELVRASFAPTSALITLDLPTLERPRKAISGRLGAGKCDTSVAAARNRARILMPQFAMSCARLASGAKERGRKNGRFVEGDPPVPIQRTASRRNCLLRVSA